MVPKASASASTSTNALTSITTHELSLSTSPFSPNPLLPLISLTRHPSPDIVHKAIYALYRSFTKIAEDGRLFAFKGESGQGREDRESKEAVAKWVRERLEEYLTVLRGLMRDSEPALRVSCLLFPATKFVQILMTVSVPSVEIIHQHLHLSSPPHFFRLDRPSLLFIRPHATSLAASRPSSSRLSAVWILISERS